MVNYFSLEIDIVISWRWCLEDFNKVTRTYVDFFGLRMTFNLPWQRSNLAGIVFMIN